MTNTMKNFFSIFLLIFFISATINAEISGVGIRNLTQLYNNQISKVLVGNKQHTSKVSKMKLKYLEFY